MIEAKIKNFSSAQRKCWTVVTFPTELVKSFGEECSFVTDHGEKWRAVKGKTQGSKTVFRILTDMLGDEEVKGHLDRRAVASQKLAIHPWVSDDVWALIPSLSGLSAEWVCHPTLVESSAAHQRWHARQKILSKGLIFEWWADIHHMDPVVRVRGKIVWSDRTNTNNNKTFDVGELILCAGEYFVMDFKKRRGITDCFLIDGKWAAALNTTHITLPDGAGLPLGFNLLAFGSPEGLEQGFVDDSIKNLYAASQGDVVGVCLGWDGNWTSNNQTPREYSAPPVASDVENFKSAMENSLGYFEPIQYGIGKTPAQTGDQEDFGAAKGTFVVTYQQLEMLDALKFAAEYELYRGINHYEEDGSMLLAENHPQWVTWSGKTHYSTSVSPDRLGKTGAAWPGNGWFGYDDQHRSQNNLGAYSMLSDDPLIENQVAHQLETDKASYRIRFNSLGAPRAQGRLLGAWANFAALDEEWGGIISDHAEDIRQSQTLNVTGPMKVLGKGGPDPRKKVYQNGELSPYVSMWEHGLAIVGLYNAWKATNDPQVLEALRKVAQLLLDYGWFEDQGSVHLVLDIVWKNGEDVTLALSNGWNEQGTDPKTQEFIYGTGGVATWVFNGLLVAREVLNYSNPSLDNYIQTKTQDGPSNRRESEWWCAVEL